MQEACQRELSRGASGGVYPLLDANGPSKSLLGMDEVKQIASNNTPQPSGGKPSAPLSEVAMCASGGDISDVEFRGVEDQGTSSNLIVHSCFFFISSSYLSN